jgi:hypothetical protein
MLILKKSKSLIEQDPLWRPLAEVDYQKVKEIYSRGTRVFV